MSLKHKLLNIVGRLLIQHDQADIGKIRSTRYVPFGIHHYLTGGLLYSLAVYREELDKLQVQDHEQGRTKD